MPKKEQENLYVRITAHYHWIFPSKVPSNNNITSKIEIPLHNVI